MSQELLLDSLQQDEFNWRTWIIFTVAVEIIGIIPAVFYYLTRVVYTDTWYENAEQNTGFYILFLTIVTLIPITIAVLRFKFKRKSIQKCIMLEAKGEYEKAMILATKYADPQLITRYRQRYSSQLAQEIKSQPTHLDNLEQSASVINIHNTEINVQDSVVTDWNQR